MVNIVLGRVKELSRPYWIWAQPIASLWNTDSESLGTDDIREAFSALSGHAKWKLNKMRYFNPLWVIKDIQIIFLLQILSKIFWKCGEIWSFPSGKYSLYVITGVKPLRTGHDGQHGIEVGFSTMATAETRNVSTSFEFSPNFNNKKIMCSHKEW